METLICRREMSLLGSTSFDCAQNTIHDFQNTLLRWPFRSWDENFTKIPKNHPYTPKTF